MSSEQRPVDPQAVEDTKQQIRGLVDEISRLARQDLAPEVFYGEFLQRVVSALAAVGGAVWVSSDEGPLRLIYQINLRESLPEEQGEDHVRHARLLHRVVNNAEELLVPPFSGAEGEEEAGNPTAYLLVLAPLKSDDRPVGVVEVFQRPNSGPASQRGYLRFLAQMCTIAGEYLKGRRLKQLNDFQSHFTRADQFAKTVHDSLDPRTTSYTIANEGRRLIGVDRVSVAVRKGSRCTVEAVSGQDTMDTRSNTVVLLGKLATAVVRNGEPLWYTGPTDDLPPQIENALQLYVDECHSKSVAVIPLARPKSEEEDPDKAVSQRDEPEPVGALIIEQIEDSRPREEFVQSVEMVTEHSARALANSLEHNNLFLMPLWRTLGKANWVLQARTLPKTISIASAILVALILLFIFPADFDMEGTGVLQPTERREVFADLNGTIVELFVGQGQTVTKGQKLLEMRNTELDVQYQDISGKRETTLQDLAAKNSVQINPAHYRSVRERQAAQAQLSSERAQLRTQLASYEKQLDLLKEQRSHLIVESPIAGQIVTTWNVLENLEQRTVSTGQVLMTVANPDSEWELEVFMPEKKMGHVARAVNTSAEGEALRVEYVVSNEPENKHQGTVKAIAASAETHEEYGHSVPIRVKIDVSQLHDPRIGIEATAKVHCGRKVIGYVWFHEVFEFIQTRVLF